MHRKIISVVTNSHLDIEQAVSILDSLDSEKIVMKGYLEILHQQKELEEKRQEYYEQHMAILSKYEIDIYDRRQTVHRAINPKSKIGTYREIILRNDRPMHSTEIAQEAQKMGITWLGKNLPATNVRNAMNMSDHFVNLGGNIWDVVYRDHPSLTKGIGQPDASTQ